MYINKYYSYAFQFDRVKKKTCYVDHIDLWVTGMHAALHVTTMTRYGLVQRKLRGNGRCTDNSRARPHVRVDAAECKQDFQVCNAPSRAKGVYCVGQPRTNLRTGRCQRSIERPIAHLAKDHRRVGVTSGSCYMSIDSCLSTICFGNIS